MTPEPVIDSRLVILFERLCSWVGIPQYTAPVLAAFYLNNYTSDKPHTLSSDEVCRMTGYSRANTALIIAQLEAMGVVAGQRDYTQTGRGRKRVLYTVEKSVNEFFQLGLRALYDRLEGILKNVDSIQQTIEPENKAADRMLSDIRSAIIETLTSIRNTSVMKNKSPGGK